MTFKDRLRDAIQRTSPICLGIDPHFNHLAPFFAKKIEQMGELKFVEKWACCLIDSLLGDVAAVKFQSAFFEALGSEGVAILHTLFRYASEKNLLTIYDAKRGDIASTMQAYGRTSFDYFDADCLTITPYMGVDVVKPLFPWFEKGKGCYLVWVTSNPAAKTVQDLSVNDKPFHHHIYEQFMDAFCEAELEGSLGLVLGLTKIDQVQLDPSYLSTPLLLPGYGPQNGRINSDLRRRFKDFGADLLPSSRGITGLGEKSALQELEAVKNWDDYAVFVKNRCRALKDSL